uniref:NADH-ubiquinone oxidoreductase chain 3 n=1 Tax=Euaspis polynesia TaxID=1352276 RepID=A0A7T5BMU4_9HYME|nr:NADH dehydrogenase subunit 3 [Euaspis polynesia]QQD78162.1 NADH dehydrogenase subunit 3 [Euaspis polynesia]
MKLIKLLFMCMKIIIMMMFLINFFLMMINKKNRNKSTPFECGFNPHSNSRLPFSNNFFLIMLMFLIFDVEIILILPSIFLFKFINPIIFFLILFILCMLLMISILIEWLMNLLKWIF